MYRFAFFIIKIIAFFSLYIFPYRVMYYVKRIKDIFLSNRFALKIKSGNNFNIESPFHVKGHRYICIGHNFSACPGLRIECWDKYAGYSYFPQIVIGNNVLMGSQVLIIDHAHGEGNVDMFQAPIDRKLFSKGPIVIEDNVWIGDGVCILANVTIGCNSIIGANAVITKDIPPYSTVVGNNIILKRRSN